MSSKYTCVTNITRKRTRKGAFKIIHEDCVFAFRRNFNSKKLKMSFKVYFCEIKGCKASIRTSLAPDGKSLCFYRSNKPHVHHNGGSGTVGGSEASNGRAGSGGGGDEDYGIMEIKGLIPNNGPVDEDVMTHIFFTVSRTHYYLRFLEGRDPVGTVLFGKKRVTKIQPVLRIEQHQTMMEKYGKEGVEEKLLEVCKSGQFVLPCWVPRGDRCIPVDVAMILLNHEQMLLPNGYTYTDSSRFQTIEEGNMLRNSNSGEGFGEDMDFWGNNDFHLNGFPDDIDNLGLGGLGEDEVDMFLSNALFYAVARNLFEVVKILVEKKKYRVTYKDVNGVTPIDVAKFFKRDEIYSYLLSKVPQKRAIRRLRVVCCCCDGSMEKKNIGLDLEKMTLSHACPSKSGKPRSRSVNYNKKRVNHFSTLKFRHYLKGIVKCGEVEFDCLYDEGGNCTGCGGNVKASKLVLNKRHISVYQ